MTFQTTFLDKPLMAELTAKMLLEVEAVRINVAEPFITTSGWATPVYTDCRKLISYPRLRNTLMDFAVSTIMRDIGFEHLDGIAGGETAGIPFAAWVADRLMLPMQYVRKKPKGFGRRAQIEGDLSDGDNILLVEDMATDGQSKFLFTDALRNAGANVSHAFVIFYYDIFAHSQAMFDENQVTLHRLATWWDVLKVCKEDARFDTATIGEIEAFLHAPNEWSTAHGGAG